MPLRSWRAPSAATTSCGSSTGVLGVGSRASKTFCRTRWSRDASAKTTRTRPACSPKPTPASAPSSRSSMQNFDPLVTTDWLADHLQDDNVRVVDIRGYVKKTDLGEGRQKAEYLGARDEYDDAHVPGAVYADWTSDITDPEDPVSAQVAPSNRFAEAMGSLGIGDDTHVVIYDHAGGQFATRLWWALTYYGHDRVFVLDGGWKKWTAEDRPTTSEVPEPGRAACPRSRAPVGGRRRGRCSLRASAAAPSSSTPATRASTPAPWRAARGERAAFPGLGTCTPTASSIPRAGPSVPTRSWLGCWGRPACPRKRTRP